MFQHKLIESIILSIYKNMLIHESFLGFTRYIYVRTNYFHGNMQYDLYK